MLILLFLIIIICYYYPKLGQNKKYLCTNNRKTENNELKKVSLKNRTCYSFDGIIKFKDFDFDNILLDEKSYENNLTYNISHKTLIDAKFLHILFDKVDVFITVYDGTRYLVLFGPEKYDAICNRMRYPISQKSGITYASSHNYAKIKIDSYDLLYL